MAKIMVLSTLARTRMLPEDCIWSFKSLPGDNATLWFAIAYFVRAIAAGNTPALRVATLSNCDPCKQQDDL